MKLKTTAPVYFEYRPEQKQYPTAHYDYCPSARYPEYCFNEYALEDNVIYDMVRECLYGLELDQARYGTSEWNPLGDGIIKPDDTVLVKPNMVLDVNHLRENGEDCLITHPSIVRAIVDYVFLAIGKGNGKVIIADAPVQSCDFEHLVNNLGYREILNFYIRNGKPVQLCDLRQSGVAYRHREQTLQDSDISSNYRVVDLGEASPFYEKGGNDKNLRITNYLPSSMRQYHAGSRQAYCIA